MRRILQFPHGVTVICEPPDLTGAPAIATPIVRSDGTRTRVSSVLAPSIAGGIPHWLVRERAERTLIRVAPIGDGPILEEVTFCPSR